MNFPRRGEVYRVNLDPTIGTEIAKTRPALIISNDTGNQYSERVTVAPITSNAGCARDWDGSLPSAWQRWIAQFASVCPSERASYPFTAPTVIPLVICSWRTM